jgi:hypothetical protein
MTGMPESVFYYKMREKTEFLMLRKVKIKAKNSANRIKQC